MIKIKKLELEKVYGYRSASFDFDDLGIFYGQNGCGKCISADTQIVCKKRGQIPIGSLFDNLSLRPDTWYDTDFEVAINGKWQSVNRIYYNGNQETRKVTTSFGYSLEGSYDRHSVLSVSEGDVNFKKLQDLQEGDIVAISRKGCFPDSCLATESQAAIMGYLVAEGHVTENGTIKFFNSDDDVIVDFQQIYQLAFEKESLPVHPSSLNEGSGEKAIGVRSKDAKMLTESLGLSRNLSGEKNVPSSVLGGTKSIVVAFIQRYFEGDGGVEKNRISASSKSRRLLADIQLLLLRLGIVSSLRERNLKYTKHYPDGYISYRLSVCGRDALRFAEEIGFISSRKKKELNNLVIDIINKSRNPNSDVIPSKGKRGSYLRALKKGISKDKLEACSKTIGDPLGIDIMSDLRDKYAWLKEDYFFDTVEKIEGGHEELFDICVEDDHCYWTNGFISHNSTVLDVIRVVSCPWRYLGRDTSMIFRKMAFHPNYDPSTLAVNPFEGVMRIEATFDTDDGDKKVIVEYDSEKIKEIEEISKKAMVGEAEWEDIAKAGEKIGIIHNELERREIEFDGGLYTPLDVSYYPEADNPMMTGNFQVHADVAEEFLDIAKATFGYDCRLESPVVEWDKQRRKDITFFTDFVVDKEFEGTTVHYRSMSAGERKIATLLRLILHPVHRAIYDIYLIDNLSMHVFYQRHVTMFDKIKEHLPEKQMLVTTHSGELIRHLGDTGCLYDVVGIKREANKYVNSKS